MVRVTIGVVTEVNTGLVATIIPVKYFRVVAGTIISALICDVIIRVVTKVILHKLLQ